MRNPVPSLCFLWLATLMSTAVYAQNAQISGIIKDQTGAILPGVTVTARNVETGLARTAVSQTAGEFRIPALPPGTYTVSTELSGFAVETRPDIVLIIDQDDQLHAQAGARGRSHHGHGRVAHRGHHEI